MTRPDSADLIAEQDVPLAGADYSASTLPDPIFLGNMAASPGTGFGLALSATDGNTPEVRDRLGFAWGGEQLLVFGRPPIAGGPDDRVVECTARAATTVVLDGRASVDPDGGPLEHFWLEDLGEQGLRLLARGEVVSVPLGLGRHAIVLRVEDPSGLVATDRFEVVVADTTPPLVSGATSPRVLWPPDHRLVPVAVDLNAEDICSDEVAITPQEVRSSEMDDRPGSGDGSTTGDIREAEPGTDDRRLLLRAERSGSGDGRRYEMTYRVTDAAGNARLITLEVLVPHAVGAAPHDRRPEPGDRND